MKAQSGTDLFLMNVAQCFDELRIISNVEVVMPPLPEVLFPTLPFYDCHPELARWKRAREGPNVGLSCRCSVAAPVRAHGVIPSLRP
jgi:hypothetical protein